MLRTSRDLEEHIRQAHSLIILGMHRSGTSLIVRLLKDLGIHMGSYLSRDAEAVHFQKINRNIFAAVGSQWGDIDALLLAMRSEKFIQSHTGKALKVLFPKMNMPGLNPGISAYFGEKTWEALSRGEPVWWGWKDPRTTITFPIWLRIFPQARFLHILRNGIDVAISIHRRSLKQHRKIWKRIFPLDYSPKTLDFNYCFTLWEKYISFVHGNASLLPPGQYLEIRYEDLLANPHHNLRVIAKFIEYPLNDSMLTQVCDQIDTSRLVNTAYARPYLEQIPSLVNSPWMAKLDYSYEVEMNG